MSQLSERVGGTGFEAPRVWTPRLVSSKQNRISTAVDWRRRYRRKLLVTDVVLVGAAASLPTVASLVQVQGAGRFGALAARASGAGFVMESYGWSLLLGLIVAVSWLVALQVFQSRSSARIAIGAFEYKAVTDASATLAGGIAIIGLLGENTGLRAYLVLTVPVGMLALLLGRWLWRNWLQRQRLRGHALSDVVVYGQAKDTPYVIRQITNKSGGAYRVVGVVLDGEPDEDAENLIRVTSPALPMIHGGSVIEEEISRLGADAVVVAGALQGGNHALQELGWRLEKSRTDVILVSSLTNVAGPRFSVRPVEGLPLMHVEQPTFSGVKHVLKRGMDMCVATTALIALSPLFLVLGLLISRDSKGGVFFQQERTGRHGQPFKMYKFRSMVDTAEKDLEALKESNDGAGPLFKLKQDPRVTRVGRILRKFSLDELPQFFNVLKGDMSVVGPRPPLPSEVADYEGHTYRRLYIKPGVTGLWQVSGRSDLDWEESVRLDLYYVENWSATGDLMIMWRTFKVMINPAGAY
ncbi:sugar transferase [Arthrobacter rhombi]|uniref:sugar transferase n=1 Tax=Arthrobacter rhombi TaxID=71253 RepID=UPI003FD11D2A